MPGLPFLDTNLILRHTLQDHADHSPRATAFIGHIEAGDQRVRTADAVIFEAAFTLERTYRVPRVTIRDGLWKLLSLPGVVLPGKLRYRRAFALYVAEPKLSFADCYFVALMESLRLTDLISFDLGFDRVATITRKEPDSAGRLPA
jgi:predicted nucleic acid-binding protein